MYTGEMETRNPRTSCGQGHAPRGLQRESSILLAAVHLRCSGCSLACAASLPWPPPSSHGLLLSACLCPAASLKKTLVGFPGGAVVEGLPVNAGNTGSSPGLGRFHMPRSNWAREPQLLSPHVWSLSSATREATTVRGPRTAMRSGLRLPQLEKALAQK